MVQLQDRDEGEDRQPKNLKEWVKELNEEYHSED